MKARILLVIIIFLLFGGCTSEDSYTPNAPPQVIADIAYDVNESHGYTVYIKENDEYVPYLVLTNDYGGNCLLLRKYVLDEPMAYNDKDKYKGSYYENCFVDTYLNSEFINSFSDSLKNSIILTDIEITAIESIDRVGKKTTYISRKLFLLSYGEITGVYSLRSTLPEGKQLLFFTTKENRIAYDIDNNAQEYFIRTPFLGSRTAFSYIDSGGGSKASTILSMRYGEIYNKCYVRPAFCISNNTVIHPKETEDNQIIYIIQ